LINLNKHNYKVQVLKNKHEQNK